MKGEMDSTRTKLLEMERRIMKTFFFFPKKRKQTNEKKTRGENSMAGGGKQKRKWEKGRRLSEVDRKRDREEMTMNGEVGKGETKVHDVESERM